jgi:hypothetical protein
MTVLVDHVDDMMHVTVRTHEAKTVNDIEFSLDC